MITIIIKLSSETGGEVMTVTKFSKQRESIKEYLIHTKEHPTADMVYFNIRQKFPNISLGTVYRNLNFLEEQGEIVRLTDGVGSDRFDGNLEPHYHFVCRKCKKFCDLEMNSLEHINTLAAANFRGKIEGHTTLFNGLCEECFLDEKGK